MSTLGRPRIPDSELIEDIRAGAVALGHPPKSNEYRQWGGHSCTTVLRRWGSWGAALDAAGLEDGMSRREIVRLYREGDR